MEKPRIISALNPSHVPKARGGYALIVVLFSLTVLTLIFGTSTARTLAHIERGRTDALLSLRQHDGARMAELVMQVGLAGLNPEAGVRPAVLDGVMLQPVTGLIDLNTASSALLQLLLDGYGLQDATIREGLERYRAWRREGRKLLRVSDFARVIGLTEDMLPGLARIATVYSGRSGVAPEQAPLPLLLHLTHNTTNDRATLLEMLDVSTFTAGTEINNILSVDEDERAVVHLGGSSIQSRILALD